MASSGDPRRAGAAPGPAGAIVGVLAAGALVSACFRDEGPDQQCVGAECLTTGSATTTTTGATSSTGEPTPTTTTGDPTTGAPQDPGITLRIDSMRFVDPHLFISDGDGGDTGTSGGDVEKCVNDVTNLVNDVLNKDITDGNFNLLAYFEDFGVVQEMRLLDGECEDPPEPGGLRVCTRNVATPAVILDVESVLAPDCRQLEPAVYAEVNLPAINDPQPPCLRTLTASFSLPISDAVGSLDLRDAQMVAKLDDLEQPTRLVDGILTGFLPMAAAQNLELEAPLFGLVNLWSVIEAAPCTAMYPELLPSVDLFKLNEMDVPGVWIAINFTAERVQYSP